MAVVSNSETHKADEVSEVRLMGETDDELDEVSQVDYDEVCEVWVADERRRAGTETEMITEYSDAKQKKTRSFFLIKTF